MYIDMKNQLLHFGKPSSFMDLPANIREETLLNTTSSIDKYMSKVYRWVILIITGACACAGITFSLLKLLGFYQNVNWGLLLIFVFSCLVYVGIGNGLISRCMKDGKLDPKMLTYGKIFLAVILLIQYNFILYLVPSKDFWAFAFFFVILSSFFLDYKLVLISIAEIGISLIFSWVVDGAVRLPVKDELFVPEMVLRLICVALSFMAIFFITFFISKFLTDTKQNEPKMHLPDIEKTVGIINDIANSLDSLAANASKLASETTETLSSLKNAANEDKSSEETHLAKSDEQLAAQGKELVDTVASIRNLTSLLKESVAPEITTPENSF